MAQQPEHDVILLSEVRLNWNREDAIRFEEACTGVRNSLQTMRIEMAKQNCMIIHHTINTTYGGVIITMHGRKIDNFGDEPRCHVIERTSPFKEEFIGKCQRCGKDNLNAMDAFVRCYS